MALEDVNYINNFPLTFSLQDEFMLGIDEIDVIGVKDIAIYDSIMILATRDKNAFWSFVSLPEHNVLGSFLHGGSGPLEFTQAPKADISGNLYEENGSLFAYIYDFDTGRLVKMDISSSIEKGKLHAHEMKPSLPRALFDLAIIDSTKFVYKIPSDDRTQQIRYMNDRKSGTIFLFMDKLNAASIKEGEDLNILSTATKLNLKNNKIVEMPIGLNYINLYSLYGSWGKTICIGEELDNIEKIQYKNKWERMYTFSDIRIFPDFFGVIYINEREDDYEMKRTHYPSILLFDWEGNALVEIKLNRYATSFDFDLVNGSLYAFDVESDDFFYYNVADILGKIK